MLVRFKPGVSISEIKRIAVRNNDILEDEIESVNGLVSIDDLDNTNAETTAPISRLPTPKLFTYTGSTGTTTPKPTITKNPMMPRT